MKAPDSPKGDPFWIVLLLLPPLLLLPRLGSGFLWQDEAETALLGQRILTHGLPLGDEGDGESPVISDQEHRVDLNADGVWIWSPWLDKYVAAAGLGLLGDTALAARLPFALLAWAAVLLAYAAFRDTTGDRGLSRLAVTLLFGSVWFLVYSRQCRYYAPFVLASLAQLWGYQRMARERRGGWTLFVLGGAGLFQTFYPQLAASTCALGLHALVSRRPKLLARFAGGCLAVAAVSLPFFLYIHGWSRDYEGTGYGFDGIWRFAASLRAYLLFVHAYAWPFFFAVPLACLAARRRSGWGAAVPPIALGLLALYGMVAYPSSSSLGALLVAAGGAAAVAVRRALAAPVDGAAAPATWAGPWVLVGVATVLLSAGVASFPFFRYLLGILPLLALATAAMLRGLAGGRLRVAWVLALPLLAGNWAHALPLELARRVLLPGGSFDTEQLTRATEFGHAPTNGVAARVLALPDTEPTFRFLAGEYARELTEDYDGPLEGVWRWVDPRSEPGESFVVTYEHFTLMFHTDLDVHRDFELPDMPALPQWILVHSPRTPRFPAAILDAVRNGSTILVDGRAMHYAPVTLDVVELPWENIPEPYWHRFHTERPAEGKPPPMLYHLESSSR